MFTNSFINSLKLNPVPIKKLPNPQIIPESMKYKLNDLNKNNSEITEENFIDICRFFGFPEYNKKITEGGLDDLIIFLSNLEIEYRNYGIQLPSVREYQIKINEAKELYKMEEEADMLEVKIVNMKDKIKRCNKDYMDRLISDIKILKSENEKKSVYKNELNSFREFVKRMLSCKDKESIINLVDYNIDIGMYKLNSYKMYKNKVRKRELLEKIEAIDSNESSIIKILIERGVIDKNYLHQLLGIDKVEFLKIIYKLIHKGLISYNKEKEQISLNYRGDVFHE